MDPIHARYPFLTRARKAVEEAEIDLVDLVSQDRSPEVIRAVERIEGAITVGRVPDPIPDPRVELLSYPIARVLLSLVDNHVLSERYAVAEARRAADLLTADLEREPELRSSSGHHLSLDEFLADFNIHEAITRIDTETYRIQVIDYLLLISDLRSEDWSLVRRDLHEGSLTISRRELETLVQEAIRLRVLDGMPLQIPDSIANSLRAEVASIEELLADVSIPADIDTVVPAAFPPCMESLLNRLRVNASLSAIERFAIVSFLSTIGLDADELISFVGVDGDENERLLRYMYEHVHGGTESTAYPPPSCATLQQAEACIDDVARCDSVGHPITAYAETLETLGSYQDWREDANREIA